MRKIPTLALLAGLLVLLLAGCFKHTYTLGTGAPDGTVVYQHWHHHWLFGILGDENLDLDRLCPSGNATIHEERSFLNGLINVLIGVVYSPTTVTVRCADGSTAQVELSREQVARITHDPRFLELVAELAPARLAEVKAALGEGTDGAGSSPVATR